MTIKKTYVIAKRNVLNELRSNNMTLQELRFFSIYLSKINAKDLTTRNVRFPLSDFQKIMELDRIKIDYIKQVTDSLLCKIVSIPNERGGYTSFQLFKECTIDIDPEHGEWYIEIDAHDKALPLMFEFKTKYFTYQLWNALRLKSSNQLRMYELLKQYEKIGERIISVEELKELLGIDIKEYPRYTDFKLHVLDICQKSLKKNTDIQFAFEPTGKKGRGGKILFLKFKIKKNTNYLDQLSLEDFINLKSGDLKNQEEPSIYNHLSFFAEACNKEFSFTEMQVLYDLVIKVLPPSTLVGKTELYDYMKHKYDELLHRATQTDIKFRFAYLKKIIEADL